MSQNNPFISVIIPAYNESTVIGDTITAVHGVLRPTGTPYEIIVVNDGSTDKSGEILSTRKDIVFIDRKINRGYGFSLKEGIEHAKGDWIFITDADGTYPIADMPKLIAAIPGADMIVGERSKDKVAMGLLNRLAKHILKILIYILAYRWIVDLNSGFRLFNKSLALKYFDILPDGFSFTTTITLISAIEKKRITYIPIDYYSRIGKSHIKPVQDFCSFVILILRTITFFKPLRFFLPISFIFFLLSVARAIRDVIVTNGFGSLTVLLFMISLQSFFFGLLADVIVARSNASMRQ